MGRPRCILEAPTRLRLAGRFFAGLPRFLGVPGAAGESVAHVTRMDETGRLFGLFSENYWVSSGYYEDGSCTGGRWVTRCDDGYEC